MDNIKIINLDEETVIIPTSVSVELLEVQDSESLVFSIMLKTADEDVYDVIMAESSMDILIDELKRASKESKKGMGWLSSLLRGKSL